MIFRLRILRTSGGGYIIPTIGPDNVGGSGTSISFSFVAIASTVSIEGILYDG